MALGSQNVNLRPLRIDNFRGGMRLNDDASKLGEGEYYLLINGRTRNNKWVPIKQPLKDTTVPSNSNYQALFGAGSILALIANGYFYYRDYAVNPSYWKQINDFTRLDPSVSNIFGALIPASSVNYKRTNTGANPGSAVALTDSISATPKALVLSDGASACKLIFANGATREANLLSGWTVNNREYVPHCKNLLFHNGILYASSVDGQRIYHSVTGRPLDFVVAIQDGRPIIDNIYEEYADRTSHAVDYEPISCLGATNINPNNDVLDAPIFVGTGRSSYLVFPRLDDLFYGEPRFKTVPLVGTGPLNQNSFIELLGGYYFIDEGGIRSFNAIEQYGNEGRNSPFSLFIQPLFDNVIQDITCAWSFDNYGMFAVNTIFGYGTLVFDPTIGGDATQDGGRFVSLDIHSGVGKIKQFAEIKVGTSRRLFFIDSNNNLFEAFAGANATSDFYPREWSLGDDRYEHRMESVKVNIKAISSAGALSIGSYTDEQLGDILTETLAPNANTSRAPMPYGTANLDSVRSIEFPFSNSTRGFKIGAKLSLTAQAEVVSIQVTPEIFEVANTEEEQANVYGS